MAPRISSNNSASNNNSNNYPNCSVCGNGGARFHYHGLVCQSCRVFFIRTVAHNKPLVCNRGGDCSTLLGNSCNACAACRFKRCLEAKMDCSAVGKKRKPTNAMTVIKESSKNRAWKEQLHETLSPQTQSWFQNTSANVIELALFLVKLEFDINTLDNPTTSHNDELDFTRLFKLGCNNGSSLKQKHPESYYLRMATEFMENLRFCPEIKALETADKIILLEQSQLDFGLFTHKYYSWVAKKNIASAFMAVCQNNIFNNRAETIEEIFENCGITACEFVILKIIMLLSPCNALSQDGHWYIVLARSRFTTLLTELSRKQYPTLSPEHFSLRIAKLLQTITKINEETTFQKRNISSADLQRAVKHNERISPQQFIIM